MIHTKNYSSPFDFYDFFGYLFPGFVMFIYIYSFIFHHYELAYDWHNKAINYCFSNVFLTIFIVILFIVGIYVIGHLIATAGSLILDRIFMVGIFGFPYNFLLRLNAESEELIENSYKLIFLFYNLLIIISILEYFYEPLKYLFYSIIIYKSLIVTIFIFYSSFNLNRRKLILDFLKKYKIYSILYKIPIKITNYILNIIKILANNNKPFTKEVIFEYSYQFKKCFGIDYDKAKDENFWLPYFYVTSTNPVQEPVLRKWHHLYGYNRNICCASSIYIIFLMILINFWDLNRNQLYIELLIIYIIAVFFYMRYINLFQNYLLKNIIRSFISVSKIHIEEMDSSNSKDRN